MRFRAPGSLTANPRKSNRRSREENMLLVAASRAIIADVPHYIETDAPKNLMKVLAKEFPSARLRETEHGIYVN